MFILIPKWVENIIIFLISHFRCLYLQLLWWQERPQCFGHPKFSDWQKVSKNTRFEYYQVLLLKVKTITTISAYQKKEKTCAGRKKVVLIRIQLINL